MNNKIEQCYGIILIFKESKNMFLILERKGSNGDWTFAKGHQEENETPRETALREVEEETGIKDIEILNLPLISEKYEVKKEDKVNLKVNEYFIGYVKDKGVKIQEKEIQSYRWVTFKEALNLFVHESRKEVLKQARKYLEVCN